MVANTPDKAVVVESGPRAYTARGIATDDSPAFAVRDGNYLSARWPRDAYLVAKRLIALLRAC